MLNWKIKDGLIQELSVNGGENLILPWGAETADEWSFFSLEKGVGYRHQRLNERLEWDEKNNNGNIECQMRQGHFRLQFEDRLLNDEVLRSLSLETLESTVLMDFVLRFRFKKEFFPKALIAGNTFEHINSNVYHQFAVSEASLFGLDQKITIRIDEAIFPSSFKPHLYVRDRGDEWIIHARMIPVKHDRERIKICNALFMTSPIPRWLGNFLLRSNTIRNQLWYRGERAPYATSFFRWLNLNAFPFCTLPKGEKLSWKVRMIWNKI